MYSAPEVLEKNYGFKADIWSCGLICYFCLTGLLPFNEKNEPTLIQAIKQGSYTSSGQVVFPNDVWDNISELAKNFVSQLLAFDPEKRPSAEQALQHEWIVNYQQQSSKDISANVMNNLKAFKAETHSRSSNSSSRPSETLWSKTSAPKKNAKNSQTLSKRLMPMETDS